MLTLPSHTECAAYTEDTGIASFAQYVAEHGCEWDDYACCFGPDDSCELVCSRGFGWENYFHMGVGSWLGLGLLLCVCVSTCRWRGVT